MVKSFLFTNLKIAVTLHSKLQKETMDKEELRNLLIGIVLGAVTLTVLLGYIWINTILRIWQA